MRAALARIGATAGAAGPGAQALAGPADGAWPRKASLGRPRPRVIVTLVERAVSGGAREKKMRGRPAYAAATDRPARDDPPSIGRDTGVGNRVRIRAFSVG